MAGIPPLMVGQAEEDIDRDKRSLIELMLSTVDKSEQFSREAARQVFFEPNQPFYTTPFKEIFEGKRQEGDDRYTSEEFRNDLYDKFGLEKLASIEAGLGDKGKLAADIATDLIFNADNLVFGLPGKVVGSAGGLATDALKTANITDKSKVLRALSKIDPTTIGRMTTGAVLGSVMQQEDDDAGDVLKKTLLGAMAGLSFSPGAGKMLSGLSKMTDNTIDAFNRAYRSDFYKAQQKLLKDIPIDERMGLESGVGIKDVVRVAASKEKDMLQRAHFYRKELESVESGLTDAELGVYDNLRLQAAGMSKVTRDKYYRQLKKKLTTGGRRLRGAEKNALLNEANRRANSVVGKKMLPIIQEADPSGKVVRVMDEFVKFNRKKIAEYNKAIPQNKNPYLVGFDYYMPSIVDDLGAPTETLVRARGGFKRVRSVDTPDLSQLSRGEIRDLAAQRYTYAFLSGQERTARMLLSALNNTPIKGVGGKFVDTTLDTFDRFQRLIVAGQLFAHSGWVATNYLDNLGRAFMVGGLGTALKAAVGGGLGLAHSAGRAAIENSLTEGARKILSEIPLVKPVIDASAKALNRLSKSTLMGEILESTHPSAVGKGNYDHDILELANITGVIDTDKTRQFLEHWNQFGGIRTTIKGQKADPKIFSVIDDAIESTEGIMVEAALKTAKLGGQALNKTTSAISGALSQTVARIGTANEAYTRIKTFEHVLKAILEETPGSYKKAQRAGFANVYQQGIIKDAADRAAQIVEDTFFDYSKVTMFEKAVGKRVMPYWTFYTRNAHFWLKSLTDPKMVGHVIKNARVLKNLGREPTKEERKFIAPYALEAGARVLPWKTPDGRVVAINMPGASLFEALSDVGGLAALAGKITGLWPKGVTSERMRVTEKVSPILKPLIEVTLGRELFTGQPMLPSETPEGRKRVFSDALVTKALLDYLPPFMVPFETKIYVDQKGRNYFVEDDTFAGAIVVRRNIFPLRFLESVMGYRKDVEGVLGHEPKRTPLEAGIHYWTPFSVRPYTNEEQVKGIKRTLRKKKRSRRVKEGMEEFTPTLFGEQQ